MTAIEIYMRNKGASVEEAAGSSVALLLYVGASGLTKEASMEKAALPKAVKMLRRMGLGRFTKGWNKALQGAQATQTARLKNMSAISGRIDNALRAVGAAAPRKQLKPGLLSAPTLGGIKSKAVSVGQTASAKQQAAAKQKDLLLRRLGAFEQGNDAKSTLARYAELGPIRGGGTEATRNARFFNASRGSALVPTEKALRDKHVRKVVADAVQIPVTPSKLTEEMFQKTNQVGLTHEQMRQLSGGLVDPGNLQWRGVRDPAGRWLGKSLYPENEAVFSTGLPSAARPYALGNMFGSSKFPDVKYTPPGKLQGIMQARSGDKINWRFGEPFNSPHIGMASAELDRATLEKLKREMKLNQRVNNYPMTTGNNSMMTEDYIRKFHNQDDAMRTLHDLRDHTDYKAFIRGIGTDPGRTTLVDSNARMWDVSPANWLQSGINHADSLARANKALRNQPRTKSLLNNGYISDKSLLDFVKERGVDLLHG